MLEMLHDHFSKTKLRKHACTYQRLNALIIKSDNYDLTCEDNLNSNQIIIDSNMICLLINKIDNKQVFIISNLFWSRCFFNFKFDNKKILTIKSLVYKCIEGDWEYNNNCF
jgi:hypothetical protein